MTEGGALLGGFGVPAAAEALWRLLVSDSTIEADLVSQRTGLAGDDLDAAVDVLLEAQLVRRAASPLGIAPIDPSIAVEAHVIRAERAAAARLQELNAIRGAVAQLGHEFAQSQFLGASDAGMEVIVDAAEIRRQLNLATEGCKTECRALYHFTSIEGLRDSEPQGVEMLRRGVRSRTIVRSAHLSDTRIYAHLQAAHLGGELVRTLQRVPTHLVVLDDSLATLAVDPATVTRGAIFIRIPSVVELMAQLFDLLWASADPIFTEATGVDSLLADRLGRSNSWRPA